MLHFFYRSIVYFYHWIDNLRSLAVLSWRVLLCYHYCLWPWHLYERRHLWVMGFGFGISYRWNYFVGECSCTVLQNWHLICSISDSWGCLHWMRSVGFYRGLSYAGCLSSLSRCCPSLWCRRMWDPILWGYLCPPWRGDGFYKICMRRPALYRFLFLRFGWMEHWGHIFGLIDRGNLRPWDPLYWHQGIWLVSLFSTGK